MTTAVAYRNDTFPQNKQEHLPVEIQLAEEEGRVWLKSPGRKAQLVCLTNLWGIHAGSGRHSDRVQMDFAATDGQGRVIPIFQDLLDGNWYETVPLGSVEQTSFQPALSLF